MGFHREPLRNQTTQPAVKMSIFNKPEVIADGWCFVMRSCDLKTKQIHSFSVGLQALVVWRSESGKVSAMDAYCPHKAPSQLADFPELQGEDGEVYENMRFNPNKLLPIDRPVGQYIQYVNKISASAWGKNQ